MTRNQGSEHHEQGTPPSGDNGTHYSAAPGNGIIPPFKMIWGNLTQLLNWRDRQIRERYARKLAEQDA